MLNQKDSIRVLNAFFKKNKFGKLPEFFSLLGTNSRMSVFRRLKLLNYLSSYTDAGCYYTLQNIPNFDLAGLWYFNEVGFSQKGSLKETVLHLIETSDFGKTHEELEKQLHVRVQNTLLDLISDQKVTRIKKSRDYVYIAKKHSKSEKQILNRENIILKSRKMDFSDWIIIEVLAAIIRIKSIVIDSQKIVSELNSRNISITIEHVEQILNQFKLKKTLDSSS